MKNFICFLIFLSVSTSFAQLKEDETVDIDLILAVKRAEIQNVQNAIEYGANVNSFNDLSFRIAVITGNLEILNYLLSVNVNYMDIKSLGKLAISYGYEDIFKILLKEDFEQYCFSLDFEDQSLENVLGILLLKEKLEQKSYEEIREIYCQGFFENTQKILLDEFFPTNKDLSL